MMRGKRRTKDAEVGHEAQIGAVGAVHDFQMTLDPVMAEMPGGMHFQQQFHVVAFGVAQAGCHHFGRGDDDHAHDGAAEAGGKADVTHDGIDRFFEGQKPMLVAFGIEKHVVADGGLGRIFLSNLPIRPLADR